MGGETIILKGERLERIHEEVLGRAFVEIDSSGERLPAGQFCGNVGVSPVCCDGSSIKQVQAKKNDA